MGGPRSEENEISTEKGADKPAAFWRLLRRNNPRAIRAFQAGHGRRLGLVLTTTGRRTGKPRSTPLQYEEIEGVIYVGSARGEHADWYRNLLVQSAVHVQIGEQNFSARAEPLRGTGQVFEFLRLRLRRHPIMMRLMLLMHGLPPWAVDRQLRKLAGSLAVVALRDREPARIRQSAESEESSPDA